MREKGIERQALDEQYIVERCIFALVNEGAKILEEGIAQRSSDIDVIYLNGYGFPAFRGGPMYYADSVGLDKVLARVELHARCGDWWKPAPLLEKLPPKAAPSPNGRPGSEPRRPAFRTHHEDLPRTSTTRPKSSPSATKYAPS